MWDPVPWFVGGGAVHSPEVARSLAYAATGGAEGVVLPGDLKVVPLNVPGGGVQILDGGAYIPSRAAGQTEQSYVPRNPTSDTITITPTGSSGGKSVLVGVRIEDPWIAGEPWNDPADPTTGPYVFTRGINCPAGTTSWQAVSGRANDTAYALARIDMPANTGTITAGMITDLRRLARPRSLREFYKGAQSDASVTMDTNVWKAFPVNPITGIRIPSWATHAAIRVDTTMRYISGNAYANFQSFIGPAGQQDSVTLYSDALIDATTAGGSYRMPLVMPSDGYWAIPASMRGTTVQISSRVRQIDVSGANGVLSAPKSDYYVADITWSERVA